MVMSETEKKFDELLEQLSEAVHERDQKKVEQLRPKIVRAMNAFQKEQGEKKK